MDNDILHAEFYLDHAMENFVNKKLYKLESVTLMEIINDTKIYSLPENNLLPKFFSTSKIY